MITAKGFYQLGSFCLLLEELDLTDCGGLNDKGLEYLSRCSKLLSLKLGLCTNILDRGLSYIASNCSKIHELDLYRCKNIGNDGLGTLSRGCKKLKKLNLSYCNEVTGVGMKYIAFLELRGVTKIMGARLAAVAAGCKKLSDLDLKHCEKINDFGFWELAHLSHNLRQINLSYYTISDTTLCMVMGSFARLQDVKLVHLTNCTMEGFELALRTCCVRIKKVKLLAILRFLLPSELLEILHAGGCKIRWDLYKLISSSVIRVPMNDSPDFSQLFQNESSEASALVKSTGVITDFNGSNIPCDEKKSTEDDENDDMLGAVFAFSKEGSTCIVILGGQRSIVAH